MTFTPPNPVNSSPGVSSGTQANLAQMRQREIDKAVDERKTDSISAKVSNTIFTTISMIFLLGIIDTVHWHHSTGLIHGVIGLFAVIWNIITTIVLVVVVVAACIAPAALKHGRSQSDVRQAYRLLAAFLRRRRYDINVFQLISGLIPAFSFYLCGYHKTAIYGLSSSLFILIAFRLSTFIAPPIFDRLGADD